MERKVGDFTDKITEKVKLILRVKSNAFDGEIQDLIEACKADLKIAGVEKINEDDPLIVQVIQLYCKGNYGYDEKTDKWMKAYNSLKQALAFSRIYKLEEDAII